MMVLLAMISVQFGAATAKSLFAPLGAPGVVFVRIGFAALILWLIARPQVRQYSRHQWSSAIVLGIVIAMMNLLFYESLVRLPLGVAVTIEFLGPLAVALLGSRKLRDLVWIVLAFGGVLLLAPIGDLSGLDPIGILFACGAAAGWPAQYPAAAQGCGCGDAFDDDPVLAGVSCAEADTAAHVWHPDGGRASHRRAGGIAAPERAAASPRSGGAGPGERRHDWCDTFRRRPQRVIRSSLGVA
jgi:threonine/homoserine efflux transporter RhtA